ncbi:helix-turn-helix domain-containing protein [Streptomyces sp. NPDC059929]|uniref:helix-turn-helix domain-containing protein n=1 Tax=Streptomyces sp. NPDC059929 TaxID=3347008 RepID=UPI00365AD72D
MWATAPTARSRGSPSAPTALSPPAPVPWANELAPLLSNLQRTSGRSIRALSRETRLSPSYLSRIYSGERHPSWPTTVRPARACGADPTQLRQAWAEADARRAPARCGPRPPGTARRSALRRP